MAKFSPLGAFALAVLFSLAWFAGVMYALGGREPSPLLHIVILLVPLAACGSIQFLFSRKISLTTLRRLVQIACAALLAPVLATALIWMIWVVALGHGE